MRNAYGTIILFTREYSFIFKYVFSFSAYLQYIEAHRAHAYWFVQSKFYDWNILARTFVTQNSATVTAETKNDEKKTSGPKEIFVYDSYIKLLLHCFFSKEIRRISKFSGT